MTVADRFVAAIAAQDEAALAACFADDAQLRALIPNGLRERSGAAEAAALISGWYADSSELELVDSQSYEVADRLHLAYRFVGVELGEPYTVEQQLYCVVGDGMIEQANLLCSGFRPRSSAALP